MSLCLPFSHPSVLVALLAVLDVHAAKTSATQFWCFENQWAEKMGFLMGPSMAKGLCPQVHPEPWTKHCSLLRIWQGPSGIGVGQRLKEGDIADQHRHVYSSWSEHRAEWRGGGFYSWAQLVSFLLPMSRKQFCPQTDLSDRAAQPPLIWVPYHLSS